MRRRFRRISREAPDLDITAFMNLMVILVPFLLISAVFSRIVVLELNLPTDEDLASGGAGNKGFQLELQIYQEQMVLGDGKGGVIKRILHKEAKPDFVLLSTALQQVKKRFPKVTSITILAEPNVSYEILIGAMDSVRMVEVVETGNVVQKELFPDIALGDAPKRK